MSPAITEEKSEQIEDPVENHGETIRVYHFVQSIWQATTNLTSSDIAVIIDPSHTIIYVWEGRHSLPRIRDLAKTALMSLKMQYPLNIFHSIPYSRGFRRSRNKQKIPEKILNTLQNALKSQS